MQNLDLNKFLQKVGIGPKQIYFWKKFKTFYLQYYYAYFIVFFDFISLETKIFILTHGSLIKVRNEFTVKKNHLPLKMFN